MSDSRLHRPWLRHGGRRGSALAPLLSAIVCLAVAVVAIWPQPAGNEAQLAEAESLYTQGVDLLSTNEDQARERFQASAAILATELGTADTAGLFYNRANALLRAGEVGEAIADFRAAERRAPADARIRANLAEARSRVLRSLGIPTPSVLDQASSLWNWLGERTRVALAAMFAGVALLLLRFGPRSAAALLGVLFVLAIASVGADLVRRADSRAAVLVEPTVLRKGNGDGFEQVVAEPLPAGTECNLIESRPGWTEVEISGRTRGWVKDASLIRVR